MTIKYIHYKSTKLSMSAKKIMGSLPYVTRRTMDIDSDIDIDIDKVEKSIIKICAIKTNNSIELSYVVTCDE